MKLNMINKMNKNGVLGAAAMFFITTILFIIGVLVILPLIAGGLAVPALSKIPAPIFVILGLVLLFKLMGDKKKK